MHRAIASHRKVKKLLKAWETPTVRLIELNEAQWASNRGNPRRRSQALGRMRKSGASLGLVTTAQRPSPRILRRTSPQHRPTYAACSMQPQLLGCALLAAAGAGAGAGAGAVRGFATVLILPRLRNGDLALPTAVSRTFPAWFLGVVGGAGALPTLLPAAILIHTATTFFAEDLYRPPFAPAVTDGGVARLARTMLVVLGAISLGLALHGLSTQVSLLLAGYARAAQCLRGVVLALYWRRATAAAVITGMILGVLATGLPMSADLDPLLGTRAGFAALCVNFLVPILGSRATAAKTHGLEPAIGPPLEADHASLASISPWRRARASGAGGEAGRGKNGYPAAGDDDQAVRHQIGDHPADGFPAESE